MKSKMLESLLEKALENPAMMPLFIEGIKGEYKPVIDAVWPEVQAICGVVFSEIALGMASINLQVIEKYKNAGLSEEDAVLLTINSQIALQKALEKKG